MIKQEPDKKLIDKVILLFNEKKYLEALDLSDNIINEYPDSILINNILGVIHTELKNYTLARDLFIKVVNLNPKYNDGFYNLANIYNKLGEEDNAIKNYEKVIDQCNIETVLNKPIGKLSRGFRQRVGMANVLLHEPDVLIMDEPTAGLDPNQVLEVRKTIKGLGKTILLSTHILQEVPEMADRILLINHGRLIFEGTPEELKDEPSLDSWFNSKTMTAA